jgi:hypothetical protein
MIKALSCQEKKIELLLTNALDLASDIKFIVYFEYSIPQHLC